MEQVGIWPKEGKHILAQYDEESIIVYQAYSPPIASYAIEHQKYCNVLLLNDINNVLLVGLVDLISHIRGCHGLRLIFYG